MTLLWLILVRIAALFFISGEQSKGQDFEFTDENVH
jgi:hypothetical protein